MLPLDQCAMTCKTTTAEPNTKPKQCKTIADVNPACPFGRRQRRLRCMAPKAGCEFAAPVYAFGSDGKCCTSNHCATICAATTTTATNIKFDECQGAKPGTRCKLCKGRACTCQDALTTLGHALTCMAAAPTQSCPFVPIQQDAKCLYQDSNMKDVDYSNCCAKGL